MSRRAYWGPRHNDVAVHGERLRTGKFNSEPHLNMNRVLVTGLGVLTPLGNDKDVFFSNLIEGRDGIARIQAFDVSSYRFQNAGEVRDLDSQVPTSSSRELVSDRGSDLLLAAAVAAAGDAALSFNQVDPQRVSLATGTTLGGLVSGEAFYRELLANHKKARPRRLLAASQNAANDRVMSYFGIRGQSIVISTACSASTHAIGYGFDLVRAGVADIALVGGYEPLSELTLSGFGILRALTSDKIRPFDSQRSGLVLGEGAAMIVLESDTHATTRRAGIYAEICGYGSTSDAYHMTAPHPDGDGAARAMEMALRDARISKDDVDYINAHGTATRANDRAETLAIKKVMAERAHTVPVSSIKSMIGHLLGAAGAVEAVATVLSVFHNVIPPTINYQSPDPECDLDCTPNEARAAEINVALSNSFGFGGNNGVAIFRKYH